MISFTKKLSTYILGAVIPMSACAMADTPPPDGHYDPSQKDLSYSRTKVRESAYVYSAEFAEHYNLPKEGVSKELPKNIIFMSMYKPDHPKSENIITLEVVVKSDKSLPSLRSVYSDNGSRDWLDTQPRNSPLIKLTSFSPSRSHYIEAFIDYKPEHEGPTMEIMAKASLGPFANTHYYWSSAVDGMFGESIHLGFSKASNYQLEIKDINGKIQYYPIPEELINNMYKVR